MSVRAGRLLFIRLRAACCRRTRSHALRTVPFTVGRRGAPLRYVFFAPTDNRLKAAPKIGHGRTRRRAYLDGDMPVEPSCCVSTRSPFGGHGTAFDRCIQPRWRSTFERMNPQIESNSRTESAPLDPQIRANTS